MVYGGLDCSSREFIKVCFFFFKQSDKFLFLTFIGIIIFFISFYMTFEFENYRVLICLCTLWPHNKDSGEYVCTFFASKPRK